MIWDKWWTQVCRYAYKQTRNEDWLDPNHPRLVTPITVIVGEVRSISKSIKEQYEELYHKGYGPYEATQAMY